MAVTVTIREHHGGRSRQLDARQSRMLLEELRRVRGGWLAQVLRNLVAPRRFVDIASELVISIQEGAATTEYEIVGGWVIRRRGERAVYPFYMALLLVEWLYGRTP